MKEKLSESGFSGLGNLQNCYLHNPENPEIQKILI